MSQGHPLSVLLVGYFLLPALAEDASGKMVLALDAAQPHFLQVDFDTAKCVGELLGQQQVFRMDFGFPHSMRIWWMVLV